jgi:isochorismate synthase
MTDINDSAVLDTLIEQNRSFAIYRLPGDKNIRFVMQTMGLPSVFHSMDALNGEEGFVVAPFRIANHTPVILIRPDYIERSAMRVGQKTEEKDQWQAFVTNKQEEEDEKKQYGQLFHRFQKAVDKGKLEKIVLSRKKTMPRERNFSPGQSFLYAVEKYIHSYVYLIHTPQSGTWLGSSPEILLSGEKNQWKTISLAGTRFPNTDVCWDDKNFREQELVSTYLRQRLMQIHAQTEVKGPYTVKAGELAHLRTDFLFQLPDTSQLGSLLQSLHPTPAVSGLPKEKPINLSEITRDMTGSIIQVFWEC